MRGDPNCYMAALTLISVVNLSPFKDPSPRLYF